jgi:GDP-4-dehydro-6-deoxy-D-mannose reductase
MKAFITGINGFVGRHLAEHLLGSGLEVSGGVLPGTSLADLAAIRGRLELLDLDIRDPAATVKALSSVGPDLIFHLAAVSSVADSFQDPNLAFTVNVNGTINLLEAVRHLKLDTVILLAGSAEVYGAVQPERLPITEDFPFKPVNPYAISKAATDMLGYQYALTYKLKIVRTRAFNHIGPGQTDAFVVSSFARQIAEIELGFKEPVLLTGNLESRRDFTDVRDVVRAYGLAAQKGDPGEAYNVSSGKDYGIEEILRRLLSCSKVKIAVKADASRMRPADIPVVVGDSSKLRARTGWAPRIAIDTALADTLNYWRSKLNEHRD